MAFQINPQPWRLILCKKSWPLVTGLEKSEFTAGLVWTWNLNTKKEVAVLKIIFVVNTGRLLTATADNAISLWDFNRKKGSPERVQWLQMQRENITEICMEFQDKWLYIGTDKGNVHILNMETFTLSGYKIDWNRLMDPLTKHLPGPIKHISTNPADSSKILVAFETGLICLWDLTTKKGEQRFVHTASVLKSICWHMEGKQFVCSHADGSLVTWQLKPAAQAGEGLASKSPVSIIFPHGKKDKETGKVEPCEPIEKVLWRVDRSNYVDYFVFSGGLSIDVTGVPPSITFMRGKSTTVLELEHNVMDFLLATDTPYINDYQEPKAIIGMLTNDVVAIDCKSPGYPCFKNPYAMDFNDSPVTCCKYVVDCPADLICALYKVGYMNTSKDARKGFSAGQWPVDGGCDGSETCAYSELVITGHADGSIRFWDSSSTCMQSLYKIKTAKFFEKVKKKDSSTEAASLDEDPFSITHITLCTESRLLAIAGASTYVMFFKYQKKEKATETKFMEIPIVYEVSNLSHGLEKKDSSSSPNSGTKQHFEFPPRPLLQVASQSAAYTESAAYTDPMDAFNFDKPTYEYFTPLRLRPGAQKKSPGYHAELVCLTPWVNGVPPEGIKCLTINANFGLMAYGNGSGLVIVDVVQKVCLLNMGTADLYGSLDPFQRMPKSPRPDGSPSDYIQKVDLSNYCQVKPDQETDRLLGGGSTPIPKDVARVKSPDCRRLLHKTGSSAEDSSASKSLSSSVNSLDQVIAAEGVTTVEFADTFATKNDYTLNACALVGTSLGSMIFVIINLPDRGDPRTTEPVVVSPSGSLFRIRGALLTLALFECSSKPLSIRDEEPLENVIPANKGFTTQAAAAAGSQGANVPTAAFSTNSIASTASSTTVGCDSTNTNNPGGQVPEGDQQVMVFCTEKSAAVYSLPSQRQMYMQTINESSNVIAASVINFGGVKYTPALVTYTSDGFIKVFSLPSLRPMLDMYFVSNSHPRIGATMTFSNFGHGIYMANPTEVQKFSISSEFMRQLPEMRGRVFTDDVPMPEPPKPGFLKGASSFLFGNAQPKNVDREELFGEKAGKPSSGVAKHTTGGSNLGGLNDRAQAAGTSEIAKAHQAVCERGQKLNEIEDQMENMSNVAKDYAQNSAKLKDMYKNKKWYQF